MSKEQQGLFSSVIYRRTSWPKVGARWRLRPRGDSSCLEDYLITVIPHDSYVIHSISILVKPVMSTNVKTHTSSYADSPTHCSLPRTDSGVVWSSHPWRKNTVRCSRLRLNQRATDLEGKSFCVFPIPWLIVWQAESTRWPLQTGIIP